MNESNEYCKSCGSIISECKCEENTRQKWLLIFGICSIAAGVVGYVIAFLI